jgi:hypothetical protein
MLWCTPLALAKAVTFKHEAYIWQRQWTSAVPAAIRRLQPVLTGLRVLALQYDALRDWTTPAAIQMDALGSLPVVLVVRLEQLPPTTQLPAARDRLLQLVQRWRLSERVAVRGLEIDFDSATSKLSTYRVFLQDIRTHLPADLQLSITALPTWLDSDDFPSLADTVDLLVLQLHALQRPPAPLFDEALAQRWIRQLRKRTDRHFLIALPTYGSQVHLAADHSILAVQSEQRLGDLDGTQRFEQHASAPALWAFVRQLEAQPPVGMAGIVWFRLPTVRDQRAWSPLTLAAVIAGTALEATIRVELRSSAAGSFDVLLRNTGTLDGALPRVIRLPAHCRAGDGAGPFSFSRASQQFHLGQALKLAAGRAQMIGWVRCHTLEPKDVQLDW